MNLRFGFVGCKRSDFGRADELDRDSLVRLCRSIARVYVLEVIGPTNTGQTKYMIPLIVFLGAVLHYES